MESKICNKCHIEKDIDDFHLDKIIKDGHKGSCKVCRNTQQTKYLNENKTLIYERKITQTKKYRNNNKEKLKQDKKTWSENNPTYYSNYNKTHKKRRNLLRKTREVNLKLVNPLFKLKLNIRSMINKSIKNKGFTKKSKTFIILGCSPEEFKLHLEKQFHHWMNWENYGNPKDGIFDLNKTWDIDHIIPLKTAITEEDIIRLNHYTNLQPLCSYVNRFIKKGDI